MTPSRTVNRSRSTSLGLLPFNLERLQSAIASFLRYLLRVRPPRLGQDHRAALHPELHQHPDTKIWTVEDPVEITQKGLRQVRVNRKAGIDFRPTMMRPSCARPRRDHGRRMRDHDRLGRHRGL